MNERFPMQMIASFRNWLAVVCLAAAALAKGKGEIATTHRLFARTDRKSVV